MGLHFNHFSDLELIGSECNLDKSWVKLAPNTYILAVETPGNAGTEKCSSVVPDESLLDIPSMSEAVVKPVTSMMLLLLGRMVYC